MIAHFRSHHAKRWTVLAAGCMLALAGFGLTDAVRGDDAKPQAAAASASSDAPVAIATTAAAAAAAAEPGANAAPAAGGTEPIKANQDAASALTAAGTWTNAGPGRAAAAATATRSAAAGGVVPAATAAAMRKLGESAPEINFEAIPFADAVGFLRDASDLNVFVNWRALESAGVDRNAPVTVRLKNVPYELALRYILRDAGGGTVALDFAVVDGIVNISTAEEMANDVKVRVYNIARLLHNLPSTMPADPAGMPGARAAMGPVENKADRVIQIITETVAPDSWRSAGGAVGSIREINGRLVVAQTEANHALIAKLLEEIDVADDESASAKK